MVFLKPWLNAARLGRHRSPAARPRPAGRRGLAALGRPWLIGAAGLLLNGLDPGIAAWANGFDEYAVKAAYLYNFAKFVEWPLQSFDRADAPLLICITGANPFGEALASLADKTVEHHPVEVRHQPDAANLEHCHIVFVSRAEPGRWTAVRDRCGGLPILTVSDIGDFVRQGGMIGLVESDQRIRFDINLAAARQAGLRLSSQLLKLAMTVIQTRGNDP